MTAWQLVSDLLFVLTVTAVLAILMRHCLDLRRRLLSMETKLRRQEQQMERYESELRWLSGRASHTTSEGDQRDQRIDQIEYALERVRQALDRQVLDRQRGGVTVTGISYAYWAESGHVEIRRNANGRAVILPEDE